MSEFDLINQFFKTTEVKRDDVLLGIGDDCAILSPPSGKQLAVSTDTLISGVHFPEMTTARDIGYKSLAVNLSDLAAMGAEPAWASLAISLPEEDKIWLENFMQGFNELAEKFNVALIGGDTTQGPLSITVNITGFIETDKCLKRSNANVGDLIFVTGSIGDAHVGLKLILGNNSSEQTAFDSHEAYCIDRLNRPKPQVVAGQQLTAFSVAAIDVSDGVMADLQHICTASGVGARLNIDHLPVSEALLRLYNNKPEWQSILTAGDDYELCFTCPQEEVSDIQKTLKAHDVSMTCIGEITAATGIKCFDKNQLLNINQTGFQHF